MFEILEKKRRRKYCGKKCRNHRYYRGKGRLWYKIKKFKFDR